MSGLGRHNENYEHKNASRHAEKAIYFEEIPNYLKCLGYQTK